MKRLIAVVMLGFGALAAPASAQQAVDETCACSDAQLAQWNSVKADLHGVLARDPGVGGDIIGRNAPAQRIGGIHVFFLKDHWRPIDGRKRTLCGEVIHTTVYDTFFQYNEQDWNHYIRPSAPFTPLLDLRGRPAEPCVAGKDRKHDDCIETEVTPSGLLRHVADGKPRNNGDTMCVYGPWVLDMGHGGGKPEIHPSEMLWWREGSANGIEELHLILIQDASRRFDKASYFSGSKPPGWRPWAGDVQKGQFGVAFSVPQGGRPVVMKLMKDYADNVATAEDTDYSRDAGGNGGVNQLRRNGVAIVNVTELDDRATGVVFSDVCVRANGTVQGYVQISTQVRRREGSEGFHAMRVVVGDGIPDAALAHAHDITPALTVEPIAGTYKRVDKSGRAYLTADTKLIGYSPKALSIRDVQVYRSLLGEQQWFHSYTFTDDRRSVSGSVENVTLSSPSTLRVETNAGPISADVPGLTLVGVVAVDSLRAGAPVDAPLDQFIEIIGGTGSPAMPAGLRLARLESARVSIGAVYGHHTDEHVTQSGVTLRLNEALESGTPEVMSRVFGTATPIDVSLAVSGGPVSDPSSFASGPFSFELIERIPAGATYRLATNQMAGIDSMTIGISAREVFGSQATASGTIYSHVIAADGAGDRSVPVMQLVAAALGYDVAGFTAAGADAVAQPDARRAAAFATRVAAEVAGQDGFFTVQEMRDLVESARPFGAVQNQ